MIRRRLRQEDEGFTITEVVVVMSISTLLLTLAFSVLITISRQTVDNMGRAQQVQQARIGLAQIDRQVRSGNVISNPEHETVANSGVPPGYSLRVYTQADGVFQCAQWRVVFEDGATEGGRLEYRSWDPAWQSTGLVEDWRAVGHHLIDQTAIDPSAAKPFYKIGDDDDTTQAHSVRVSLWLRDAQALDGSKASTIETVITGRNTVFGYPQDRCDNVPTP